jgi:hypothetical protein
MAHCVSATSHQSPFANNPTLLPLISIGVDKGIYDYLLSVFALFFSELFTPNFYRLPSASVPESPPFP